MFQGLTSQRKTAFCLGPRGGIKWKHRVFIPSTALLLFSHSVVSDSLRPHWLQHARLPCPSPSPGVHPNPCPLSQWSHPTISSSVAPFSSCLQSFPASESCTMSQFSTSGGQSIAASASASSFRSLCYSRLRIGMPPLTSCCSQMTTYSLLTNTFF